MKSKEKAVQIAHQMQICLSEWSFIINSSDEVPTEILEEDQELPIDEDNTMPGSSISSNTELLHQPSCSGGDWNDLEILKKHCGSFVQRVQQLPGKTNENKPLNDVPKNEHFE